MIDIDKIDAALEAACEAEIAAYGRLRICPFACVGDGPAISGRRDLGIDGPEYDAFCFSFYSAYDFGKPLQYGHQQGHDEAGYQLGSKFRNKYNPLVAREGGK